MACIWDNLATVDMTPRVIDPAAQAVAEELQRQARRRSRRVSPNAFLAFLMHFVVE